MRRWRTLAILALTAGCWQDAVGPDAVPRARLVVATAFENTVAEVVTVTRLRLLIERSNGDVALDTTITVAPDADSVAVDVSVTLLLTAPSNPPRERFLVRATLSGPGGDPLFESGPDEVEAVGGTAPNALAAALRYVGVGANAQSVVIAPPPASIVSGDSVLLVATALGAGAQAIPGTPIVWTSLDPAIATVSATGRVVALSQAGQARVMARLLTGPSDTVVLNVLGPPALVTVLQGNGQSASVDAPITGPVRVRVTDALGVPRSGVTVTFVVTAGGGNAGGTTQVTNASGEATLGSWTLGPTPTINEIEARAGSATPGVIRASATWVRRVKVARNTACALTSTGETRCWGVNGSQSEYGSPESSIASSSIPVAVPVAALVEISDGHGGHTCGITAGRSAICWGRSGFGQLGSGVVGAPSTPVTVVGGITWKQVSTSVLTTCGLATSGAAYCWGHNQQGEVGSPGVPIGTFSASPVLVDGGHTFTSISAGWLHACGIDTEGEAWCWGSGGAVGSGGTETQVRTPVKVAGGHRFESLSAGGTHTCGITREKQALCWGQNGVGQLGDGTSTTRATPTPVAGNHRFSVVLAGGSAGANTTCALTEDGEPWCWGLNSQGQVGDGTTATRVEPVPVLGGLRLSGLGIGFDFACGMRGDAIWCWGWNSVGQLGNGSSFDRQTPIQVDGGLTFTALGGTAANTCGLTAAGSAYCWGFGLLGELGNGSAASSQTPVAVSGGLAFTSITDGGLSHVCGLAAAGASYCWGANNGGALGDGTNVSSRSSPVQVIGAPPFTAIAAGWSSTCGLVPGAPAWCWGLNSSGQLGDGTTTQRGTPAAVSSALPMTGVSVGNGHACALTIAGAAWCWGQNAWGAVGDGSVTQRTVPVAVVGGHTFSLIQAAESFTCGLAPSGTALCWGANQAGQLGDGSAALNRVTPGPVAGGHVFTTLSASTVASHACGLTAAGAAWCWGLNSSGQLGDGTTVTRTTPVAVAGGHTFVAIRAAGSHTCGITISGPTWCWGEGSSGQLGFLFTPSLPGRVTGF